jgi:hypothetical protein
MGKESFLKIKGCWHKFTLSLVSSISSGEDKKRNNRNERRGDARTEIERKLGGGGWLGLIWPLGLEEKFIFILFFFFLVLVEPVWFGPVQSVSDF